MAGDDVFGFNRQDADALLREIGAGGGEERQFSHPETIGGVAAIAKTGGSAIAARSGTTPGSATVTLQTNSGGTLAATSPAITVTAYNLATNTVAANTYIQIKKEYLSGTWLIDFEDCG